MFDESLAATGVGATPIPSDLGRSNGVRLSGNGFHIACAGSFVGFVLAFLKQKPEPTLVEPEKPKTWASICAKK